jgi:uncharacterized protein YbjQ (UPF0145 family)
MPDWDGVGLPPAAEARMERFGRSGLRTSLLPVAGAAGIESVGLTPVGEVMGCMVQQIGWQGYGGCGYYGFGSGYGYSPGTVTSGQAQRFGGYRPYVDALYRGYNTALRRMSTEATRMGADGIVGVRLTAEHMSGSSREFVALGTAVRARTGPHLKSPFTTDLAGQDLAKLMGAGWVPATIGIGISVAVRHDDNRTRYQSAWSSQNVEVDGYTELVTHVRSDARHRFERAVAAAGAEGAIVSDMSLNIWSIEPSDGHRDHVAESMVFGTTIARFHRGQSAPTSTLTFLPLRSKTESR